LTKLSGELTTKFQTKLENELSTALEEQNLASRRDLKGVHIVLEEHQNTASALWYASCYPNAVYL
jgi:hypothetical protein